MTKKIQFILNVFIIQGYLYKEWDCKDDLKLIKYYDTKVKLNLLVVAYIMIWKRRKKRYSIRESWI